MVLMLQNIALVQNKTGEHKKAVESCSKALGVDKQAFKAYFQRANAYLKLKEFDLAAEDCKAAITLQPSDKSFRELWEQIKVQKTNSKKSEQEAMQKFFAQGVYNEKKISQKKNHDSLPKFNPKNP